jgi:hypothetical protein
MVKVHAVNNTQHNDLFVVRGRDAATLRALLTVSQVRESEKVANFCSSELFLLFTSLSLTLSLVELSVSEVQYESNLIRP